MVFVSFLSVLFAGLLFVVIFFWCLKICVFCCVCCLVSSLFLRCFVHFRFEVHAQTVDSQGPGSPKWVLLLAVEDKRFTCFVKALGLLF